MFYKPAIIRINSMLEIECFQAFLVSTTCEAANVDLQYS